MRRRIVAGVISTSVLVLSAAAALATHTIEDPCWGQSVDIAGTDGDDSNVRGTSAADVVSTGAGVDEVYPLEGGDRLCAGTGNDFSQANGGADRLRGNEGSDVMRGEAGDDIEVQGNQGSDAVYGGDDADDAIRGGDASDLVVGGQGADNLYDGFGDDTIDGGTGLNDTWFECANDGFADTFSNIDFRFTSSSYC